MDSQSFLTMLGDRIRALRKAKKISQERLAELSSLHPTYISNMENGKVNASIYSFYKISGALGISFSELVNIPSVTTDKKIENEISVILSQFRTLGKKRQLVFLSAAKGLLTGIEKG